MGQYKPLHVTGSTIDEVESDVDAFENGTWEGFKFGNPVDGKPEAKMRTTSLKLYDFELAAVDAAAKKGASPGLHSSAGLAATSSWRSHDLSFERSVRYCGYQRFVADSCDV